MTKRDSLVLDMTIVVLVMWPSGSVSAQAGEWSRPEVQVFETNEGRDHNADGLSIERFPAPLFQHEIEELTARANSAIVPVRAVFERDPLLYPPRVEVHGVATLVQLNDGSEHLVTAFQLVSGAQEVFFELPSGSVNATVRADARFGLATLTPTQPIALELVGLPLSNATAECREAAFSVNRSAAGATLGVGDSQWAYYQLNSLGVALGHPIINRDGALLGIGSHRYPPNPTLALSVPAAEVISYLTEQHDE